MQSLAAQHGEIRLFPGGGGHPPAILREPPGTMQSDARRASGYEYRSAHKLRFRSKLKQIFDVRVIPGSEKFLKED